MGAVVSRRAAEGVVSARAILQINPAAAAPAEVTKGTGQSIVATHELRVLDVASQTMVIAASQR